MFRIFVPSPLARASAMSVAEIDCIDRVYRDVRVKNAAARLNSKHDHLLSVAGYRSCFAEAYSKLLCGDSPKCLEEIDAETVVSVLNQLVDEVDDQIEAAREDHARHDARQRARSDQLTPLRAAVGARIAELTSEAAGLAGRVDATKRSLTLVGHTSPMRLEALASVGLSREQINTLGAQVQDPESQIKRYHDRIVEINALTAPLHEFLADEHHTELLAGRGFDDLIEARRVAEQVPA